MVENKSVEIHGAMTPQEQVYITISMDWPKSDFDVYNNWEATFYVTVALLWMYELFWGNGLQF